LSRDTNFYYSFLVLTAEKRQAIVSVWDFCRAVDDVVDEPDGSDPAAALAGWRRELAACYGEGAPTTPVGNRLRPHISRFGLPRDAFELVIAGVGMDLAARRYATFAELYEYCYRVASAVGLICIEIFGHRHPGARQYAIDLGLALQLTNIIRDVRSDLDRGRLYLPLEDLRRFGCTEADLARGALTPQVVALLRFQCDRAREYYARAHAELPAEDRRRLVAAEIMAAIYRGILERIERRGYDVFREPVRVPRPRRAVIAAATWAATMVGTGGASGAGGAGGASR
jgi:phytoene synthase